MGGSEVQDGTGSKSQESSQNNAIEGLDIETTQAEDEATRESQQERLREIKSTMGDGYMTHIYCGKDGWCHMPLVIDCADREIIGWRISRNGKAHVAEAALEDALISRFGPGPQAPKDLLLRSDNGLIFLAKSYRRTVKDYGLSQEFITPYTPEQNGVVERVFRTLKEECVWIHRFRSIEEAERMISQWIRKYNTERPHESLGWLTPAEWREQNKQAA